MKIHHIIYNPLAGNGRGDEVIKIFENRDDLYPRETLRFYNLLEIDDYEWLFGRFSPEDDVIICGGDGTLSRFVNDISDIEFNNDIYYFATGSGNDFLRDIGKRGSNYPVLINDYIKNLPIITVNGENHKFINGIGYGIDGYCCEEGDKLRQKTKKPINYTLIALKGLLYAFHRVSAKITVDGREYLYKNVWLAPTMNGRYFGGGMMAAPDQNRLRSDGMVTNVVMFCKSKLKTLFAFPSIFKGHHIRKHGDMVKVHEGHKIKVEFDRPTPLQIDGETVRGVTEYCVEAVSNVGRGKQKVLNAAQV